MPRKRGMSPSVLSSIDPQLDTQVPNAPWWGAWTGFLIVGCFYLTQALGIFMVQLVVGLSMGLPKSLGGLGELEQLWVLPVSLLVGTIGGVIVSWQVAVSRAKPAIDEGWYWNLLGRSYDYSKLWIFVLLGLSVGLGFYFLTEYRVLPSDDLPQPILDSILAAPFLLKICWVIMFVVLFPVVEETLFRGFFYTSLAQSWGAGVAGILTTLVFVAVHMPKVLEYWPALVAVTLVGTLTVLMRIRSGSLLPGITMHSTYNGVLVVVGLFAQTSP